VLLSVFAEFETETEREREREKSAVLICYKISISINLKLNQPIKQATKHCHIQKQTQILARSSQVSTNQQKQL
jgi:hypothetical protein